VLLLLVMSGGSLHSILSEFGSLDEEVIAVYTRQILEGLTYLHKRHIIHRDIKGANILITNTGVVKLSDFGCSKTLNGLSTPTGAAMDASFRRIKGTIPFMAPEVIRQTGHGRKSDIWSVGCVVIEMATGSMPWAQFSNKVCGLFFFPWRAHCRKLAVTRHPVCGSPDSCPPCSTSPQVVNTRRSRKA
jgi:serine/threonine protein kinase